MEISATRGLRRAEGGRLIGILICQIVLSIVLASIFLIRPSLTSATGWKIVAFIGLGVLPALCLVGGMNTHVQRSEQTQFCVSCHVMIPYGQSLYVDDPNHIPAQHFQNHRVPADMACYSCHADYTIYGPLNDKMQGLKRIYMQYVSTPPDPAAIRIAGGFKNAQCLHCHLGARSFEENPVHTAIMDSLKSNQLSCLSSGCHDTAHDIANLSHEKFWTPVQ
jgi:nitrate/TMAO reductase-like tetraheme cytochrome c subunit